ncbi:hypothetical protein [Paraburkholderia unamae]|uniref:Uncharacterized protein n=1 Tax=Paraburkholderia unamae TaxID=219649 RepID=A0ABX5KPE4_9BURK|nr:hypothetical protein [Paraburkholderia unamae]PVX82398.1 hypothetical protein C7402_109252 [Paraburkholderia unamae]CAG9273831.1 conserved hypothetical protein [Paraburkholderia unamae]
MKALLANVVGVIGLFLVLVFPVGYILFTEPVAGVVSQMAWSIGIDRNAEPGDSLVDCALLFSFVLAVVGVFLVNMLNRQRRRRPENVE